MKTGNSFRIKSTEELDIDGYQKEDGSYFLFFILKKNIQWNVSFIEKQIQYLPKDINVTNISGALKLISSSDPLPRLKGIEDYLIVLEEDLKFKLETEKILNPGLFLDQTENRKILRNRFLKLKSKKMFLNMFSYTGAFSVLAGMSGFEEVVSIDLSARYLKWDEENCKLNESKAHHRRICEDSKVFLERELKRQKKYSWIVIDPPTFSRNGKKVFKVQKELVPMVKLGIAVLERNPGNGILASCNDEGWAEKDFYQEMKEVARDYKFLFERGVTPKEFSDNHGFKSCFLSVY